MKFTYVPYQLYGFTYECVIEVTGGSLLPGKSFRETGRLGFFTYHLIRLIHGPSIFEEMASRRIEKLRMELGV